MIHPLYPIHTNITAGPLYSMLFLSCNFLVHHHLKRHTNVTAELTCLHPSASKKPASHFFSCSMSASVLGLRASSAKRLRRSGVSARLGLGKPQRGPGVFRPPASRVRRKLRLVATRRIDRPAGAAQGCGSAHAARSGPPRHHPAAQSNRIRFKISIAEKVTHRT